MTARVVRGHSRFTVGCGPVHGKGDEYAFPGPRFPQADQLSKQRVLLADDHPSVPEMVATLLQPTFEVVGTVGDGKALLEAAARLEPDVILTDISMPILNGIEAANQLGESSCKSKIVFLTVHTDPDFITACLATRALGYVVKSHMATDLLPAIQAALAGRVFVSPSLRYTN
ncbi:MAG TPA: response regulator transcription factor [Candidatus Acidoferrales bacterium]|nr:response regulator transcription factor [Candidatus Acidoferrales bacterium]